MKGNVLKHFKKTMSIRFISFESTLSFRKGLNWGGGSDESVIRSEFPNQGSSCGGRHSFFEDVQKY